MGTITKGETKWKLRKAPKDQWSGIKQYDHTATTISPLLDKRTGRPKTGLSKDDETRLEKALRLEEGELSDRSKFWLDFVIKIGDETKTLDITDPEDELAFKVLKAHKFVAFTHDELKKKAHALFVLYNDVDEAKSSNRVTNVKKNAYAKFAAMTTKEMIDVLLVMGERIVSTDPHIIEASMSRVVETRGAEFLDIVADDDYRMKLFVMKAMSYDILTHGHGKNLRQVTLHYNDTFLGADLDGAVEFLKRKANQAVYLQIEKALQVQESAGTLAGNAPLTGYEVEEKIAAKPKTVKKDRKITSKADKGSSVHEVVGEGTDSGDYDDAPEVI